jgi:hypothetical protein
LFSTRIKIGECSLSQKKGRKKRDKRQKPTERTEDCFVLFSRYLQGVFNIIYMYKMKKKIAYIDSAFYSNESILCTGFFNRRKKKKKKTKLEVKRTKEKEIK